MALRCWRNRRPSERRRWSIQIVGQDQGWLSMSEISRESNLALFIDFDNVALGARDSRQRFDVRLLMQRVLEKGKIVVKRAYADWHFYKEHMTPLHEAAIELIEVPTPKISGKNSADIRLVVDAIDLCYAKSHIDTFVIVSGDSDFSPLVSKLRENDKRVIGIGVRSSSSHLLIANCDEFIFYDDIYHSAVNKLTETVSSVPQDKRRLFEFLLQTTQSLLQESRGVLYSSLIKDTMKRKQPEFNEANYGYTTFGELLEDARDQGLLDVERDNRAGGTLVVLGLGKVEVGQELPVARTPRRPGRRRSRKKTRLPAGAEPPAAAPAGKPETAASAAVENAAAAPPAKAEARTAQPSPSPSVPPTEPAAPAKDAATGRRAARQAKRKAAKRATKTTAVKSPDKGGEKPAPKAAEPSAAAAAKTAKKTAKKKAKKKTAKKTKSTA
jgi:uncharacterized protein (TIGR00288 family)